MTTDPDSLQLSVIMLAYNEEGCLDRVLPEFDRELRKLDISYELIFIDDGSTDRTGAMADEYSQTIACLKVHHHRENLGLGGGYRSGFALARGAFLTFYSADGQFSPSLIPRYLKEMESSDMVLGYIPQRTCSIISKTLSLLERILYRIVAGHMPKFQGILMFRKKLLQELTLKSAGRGWAIVMELIVRTYRGGYRINSIPIEVKPRIEGQSKVNNIRTIWANLLQVIALKKYL